MKKRLVALLTAAVIFASGSVYANVPDISGLTDDEIVQLLYNVNSAIADRNINKTANLPAGSYYVGEDIPPGKYILRCHYDGSWWAVVKITDGAGIVQFNEHVYGPDNTTASVKGDGEWHVTLYAGDTVEVDSPCTLTISSGITFE